MAVNVWVNGPFPRQSYLRTFRDGTSDSAVLASLSTLECKITMGRVGFVRKRDDVFGGDLPPGRDEVFVPDPGSAWLIDDPRTVVAVVEITPDNAVKEIRRLKGPPAEPKPATEGG